MDVINQIATWGHDTYVPLLVALEQQQSTCVEVWKGSSPRVFQSKGAEWVWGCDSCFSIQGSSLFEWYQHAGKQRSKARPVNGRTLLRTRVGHSRNESTAQPCHSALAKIASGLHARFPRHLQYPLNCDCYHSRGLELSIPWQGQKLGKGMVRPSSKGHSGLAFVRRPTSLCLSMDKVDYYRRQLDKELSKIPQLVQLENQAKVWLSWPSVVSPNCFCWQALGSLPQGVRSTRRGCRCTSAHYVRHRRRIPREVHRLCLSCVCLSSKPAGNFFFVFFFFGTFSSYLKALWRVVSVVPRQTPIAFSGPPIGFCTAWWTSLIPSISCCFGSRFLRTYWSLLSLFGFSSRQLLGGCVLAFRTQTFYSLWSLFFLFILFSFFLPLPLFLESNLYLNKISLSW